MDGKGMEKRRKWGYRFLFSLSLPDEAWHNYGGPKRLMISYLFDCKEPVIYLTVKWFYKPAYWLPEAIWLSFIPRVAHPGNWRLEKMGELISPLEVIKVWKPVPAWTWERDYIRRSAVCFADRIARRAPGSAWRTCPTSFYQSTTSAQAGDAF